MSYCREEGKDKLIFSSEDELSQPSSALIDIDTYQSDEKGPILDNGEINFHCTCAGTMFVGPCNLEIRDFLTCSQRDKAPENCMDEFEKMFKCEVQYPEIYDLGERMKGIENIDDPLESEIPETKTSDSSNSELKDSKNSAEEKTS